MATLNAKADTQKAIDEARTEAERQIKQAQAKEKILSLLPAEYPGSVVYLLETRDDILRMIERGVP